MKKILITEDDINLIKLYELKLTQSGFNVELARNGIECINKTLNFKPDLILLDLMMPKQNGFDTLKILKENKNTEKIPVIILSNLGQADDIATIMGMGAKEYLIKSKIELNQLVKIINQHL